ncbi:MAG: hypothetical protein N3A66_05185, partial [Planctomycetota bacterium]|nr:hypothetical protein [Planctomycetota bacterium]
TKVSVSGIPLVEDPAHPESWLRDAQVQYWDAAKEIWQDGPYLLANAAAHTHRFAKPVAATKFRLCLKDDKGWPVGNFRFAEIVFHGETVKP